MENEASKSTTNSRASRIEVLSGQILDYLEKYPEAGDTLEGIAAWWIERQRIELLVEEVAEALELLVKKGAVRAHKNLSSITTYTIEKK